MAKYEDLKKEMLEDPEVKAAYDELSSEYERIQNMVDTQ